MKPALRAYVETLDADTQAFVRFCLSEWTPENRSAYWICSTIEKAKAISKAMIMLQGSKGTIRKIPDTNSFEFFVGG